MNMSTGLRSQNTSSGTNIRYLVLFLKKWIRNKILHTKYTLFYSPSQKYRYSLSNDGFIGPSATSSDWMSNTVIINLHHRYETIVNIVSCLSFKLIISNKNGRQIFAGQQTTANNNNDEQRHDTGLFCFQDIYIIMWMVYTSLSLREVEMFDKKNWKKRNGFRQCRFFSRWFLYHDTFFGISIDIHIPIGTWI